MDMSRARATLVSTTIQTRTQKKAQIKWIHQSPTRLVSKLQMQICKKKTHQTKQNKKPAAMGGKTNNPPTDGAKQKDTVTPTPLDTSNDEESMDEGNDESS